MRVADVTLDRGFEGAEARYTYLARPDTQRGDAVFVPLGNRTVLGYVSALYETDESRLGFAASNLKSVTASVDGLRLPEPLLDLCEFVANETLTPISLTMPAAIPPGIRERIVTRWTAVQSQGNEAGLTPLQKETLAVVREAGELLQQKGKPLAEGTAKALRQLATKGFVAQSHRVTPFSERRTKVPLLRLASDAAKIDNFLLNEGRRKPAQALTLMMMQEAESAHLTAAELRAMAGVTDTTIRALLEDHLLEPAEEDVTDVVHPPKPNRDQQLAIDAVVDSVTARNPRTFLLFGVTGSGKTEVYLRAAAEALRMGTQVLFLVPEITLATQAMGRLRERFGRSVALLHSELSPGERLRNWIRIRDGEASVVLGARSALFAPLSNLGLIVVDEEHEGSYKQESTPRYHAKAVARFLGLRHSCPVVLGSATPSIESFYEAERAERERPEVATMTLLSLPRRAASAKLPEVEVEDLTQMYRSGRPSLLTESLGQKIEAALEKKHQTILFLNRRAYAPFVICRDCGFQMQCPNCTVSLSWHRGEQRLRCHHCGYQTPPAELCPKCNGVRLSAFGVGTEKVEEGVAELFPQTTVARLDRDVARRKGAIEEIFAAFRSGDIGILVGTQMIAKGLDFPNVTVVGAIAADMSLNLPDFRASERTFQLLSQVAGRAGRGSAPGRVVIQTFNPTHPAVVCAQNHDYLAFFGALLTERREAAYPPFRRLVNVVLSGESRQRVIEASEEALRRLVETDAEILGPVDCAVERLHNRWRRHLLLKFSPGASVSSVGEVLEGFQPSNVSWIIDVDPYSLM